jgi:WD40 repeat protein
MRERAWTVHPTGASAHCLAVAPGYLAVGCANGRIHMLDMDAAARRGHVPPLPERVLEGHTAAVRALAVAGGELVSGSADGEVRVWDPSSMTCLRWVRTLDPIYRLVALGGAADCLAICGWGRAVSIMSLADAAVVQQLELDGLVHSAVRTHEGALLLGQTDGRYARFD